MGHDHDFGQWLAETIPEMVEPGTWNESGKPGSLRYYGPKNILVVNHMPEVLTKVDGFLKNVKKALPEGVACKSCSHDCKVKQTGYAPPAPIQSFVTPPEPSTSYPVPAQAQHPKHLFHFIIRYEGAGVVDSNVVKLAKVYADSERDEKAATDKKDKEEKEEKAAKVPCCVPCCPAPCSCTGPASSGCTSTGASPILQDDKEKSSKTEKDDDEEDEGF